MIFPKRVSLLADQLFKMLSNLIIFSRSSNVSFEYSIDKCVSNINKKVFHGHWRDLTLLCTKNKTRQAPPYLS